MAAGTELAVEMAMAAGPTEVAVARGGRREDEEDCT